MAFQQKQGESRIWEVQRTSLFEATVPSKITRPYFQWKSAPMDIEVWDFIKSFLAQVYYSDKAEAVVRLFHHPKEGFAAVPLNQTTHKNSLSVKEDEDKDLEIQGEWVNAGYSHIGDVHSHCNASAFQSGIDKHDEEKTHGISVTLGHFGSDTLDCHARFCTKDHSLEMDLFECGIMPTSESLGLKPDDFPAWVPKQGAEKLIQEAVKGLLLQTPSKEDIPEEVNKIVKDRVTVTSFVRKFFGGYPENYGNDWGNHPVGFSRNTNLHQADKTKPEQKSDVIPVYTRVPSKSEKPDQYPDDNLPAVFSDNGEDPWSLAERVKACDLDKVAATRVSDLVVDCIASWCNEVGITDFVQAAYESQISTDFLSEILDRTEVVNMEMMAVNDAGKSPSSPTAEKNENSTGKVDNLLKEKEQEKEEVEIRGWGKPFSVGSPLASFPAPAKGLSQIALHKNIAAYVYQDGSVDYWGTRKSIIALSTREKIKEVGFSDKGEAVLLETGELIWKVDGRKESFQGVFSGVEQLVTASSYMVAVLQDGNVSFIGKPPGKSQTKKDDFVVDVACSPRCCLLLTGEGRIIRSCSKSLDKVFQDIDNWKNVEDLAVGYNFAACVCDGGQLKVVSEREDNQFVSWCPEFSKPVHKIVAENNYLNILCEDETLYMYGYDTSKKIEGISGVVDVFSGPSSTMILQKTKR